MDFKLPDIGEGLVEAQIVRWLVKEGEYVNENQPMVEVLTDKANVEIPSPSTGRVSKIYVKDGEIAKVGEVIISFDVGSEKAEIDKSKSEKIHTIEYKEVATEEEEEVIQNILAAPAVRKLARERNIDLSKIKGTGPKGRILLRDIQTQEAVTADTERETENILTEQNIRRQEDTTFVEELPIKGITKAMFDRMALAQKYSSLFTYVDECDVSELVKLKESSQTITQKDGIKLTYLPFILKAVSLSLKSFPKINATINEEKLVLNIRKDYNIGVAMSVNNNLLVPVIKNVDRKNIIQIAKELNELQELAGENKLQPENFKGGGFSVTSLGKMGGLFATPIVNYPQVAILGIHKISLTAVYTNDKLEPKHIMNLSITCDHRVIEGHYAANFLHEIIKYLEEPKLLLLHLI